MDFYTMSDDVYEMDREDMDEDFEFDEPESDDGGDDY